jgi:protein-L-isoaspartate(D-aspartate) O-methyltransferase
LWLLAGLSAVCILALTTLCLAEADAPDGDPDGAAAAEEGGVPATGSEVSADTPVAEQEAPLVWERPRFDERVEERRRMVATQIESRGIEDVHVLEAMRNVPRHRFCIPRMQRQAYADHALPIEKGQTISQPYIVGLMTDLLDLKAGDRVLEVGTGSGYQAAVLSEITPRVYTIEIIRELHESSDRLFDELGYRTIETKHGDGYYGWEDHGPFDAIIVTAAAGHVPPPLVKQLKNGGRLMIPVGGTFEAQHLVLVTKDEDGDLKARSVLPVRFVPMTGRVQEGG